MNPISKFKTEANLERIPMFKLYLLNDGIKFDVGAK